MKVLDTCCVWQKYALIINYDSCKMNADKCNRAYGWQSVSDKNGSTDSEFYCTCIIFSFLIQLL
jgi:hypothetical protein